MTTTWACSTSAASPGGMPAASERQRNPNCPSGMSSPTATMTRQPTEREPWDTVDLVAAGRTDVGVVHSWGEVALSIPEHLVTTPLTSDVADVVVPVGHRLAGRSALTPRDLVDER